MTDQFDNVKGYYSNYPDLTKKQADDFVNSIREEGYLHADNEPRPRAEYAIAWDPALIPDADPDTGPNSELWSDMDTVLDPLSIVECYNRWCHKSSVTQKQGHGRQLFASCPFPHHIDSDPSCHISPEKGDGEWFCFPCQRGGDKYALVAAALGYDLDQMHTKGSPIFFEVRKRMAEDLGWTATSGPDPKGNGLLQRTSEWEAEITRIEERDRESAPTDGTDNNVRQLFPTTEETLTIPELPHWDGELVYDGTPLHEWMSASTRTDIPDEFLLWEGIMALALAGGRNVYLEDEPNIYPSLYLMLLGSTGTGKSRSTRAIKKLIVESMPYDHEDPESHGIALEDEPQSGEGVYVPYSRRIDKPDDENLHGQRVRRVRVLWNVDEMSGFLSKATRNGSSLEQTIMQLYDCPPVMQQILAREVRFASEPFGCFLSTTQPAAIGKYLNMQHVVTGFLNRWMPVFGTPKPRQWLDRASINFAPPVASYNGVWNGWARRERAVAWERAAALGWERFALSEIEPMLSDDEDDAYSNIYSRIELLLRKLMLCFCINEQCDTITPDILRRVLEMYPYIKACYDKLTGRVADDDLSRCMDRIIAGLHQHDGVITQSTLTKWLDNWKKTFPRQMSAQALEILTKTGVIAIEKQMPEKGKTGRPATLVRLTG